MVLACVGRRDFVLLRLLHIIPPNSFHTVKKLLIIIVLLVTVYIATHTINIVQPAKSQYRGKFYTRNSCPRPVIVVPVPFMVGKGGTVEAPALREQDKFLTSICSHAEKQGGFPPNSLTKKQAVFGPRFGPVDNSRQYSVIVEIWAVSVGNMLIYARWTKRAQMVTNCNTLGRFRARALRRANWGTVERVRVCVRACIMRVPSTVPKNPKNLPILTTRLFDWGSGLGT